jgi:hypothetical protein
MAIWYFKQSQTWQIYYKLEYNTVETIVNVETRIKYKLKMFFFYEIQNLTYYDKVTVEITVKNEITWKI